MRCLIWRQHRGQLLWIGVLLLVVCLGAVAAIHSATAGSPGTTSGWCRCTTPAVHSPAIESRSRRRGVGPRDGPRELCFVGSRYAHGPQERSFTRTTTRSGVEEGIPLLLVLIGVLVGAPLVAREVEQRTHLVSWTQSVPRRRSYPPSRRSRRRAGRRRRRRRVRQRPRPDPTHPRRAHQPALAMVLLHRSRPGCDDLARIRACGRRRRHPAPDHRCDGASLVGFLFLFLASGWAVRTLTPVSRMVGDRGTPDNAWLLGGGQYHPASQYWPLQATYGVLLLAASAGLLTIGWRPTRPRRVV